MIATVLLILAAQDAPTLSAEGLRDRTGDGLAFLEVEADRRELFVEQRFTLTLRIAVAEEFLESGLIQLFRRSLDVPVQVQAGWLDTLPGADPLPPLEGGRTTLAVDGAIVAATTRTTAERSGTRFHILELTRPYVANSAGVIEVPPSRLRFAYATRFREDFVNGRVAEDRIDAFVLSEPLSLSVRELPLEGQPPEFRGAVGDFTVEASASPRDIVVGERLQLTLEIRGSGNLERLRAPTLDDLRGLSVIGSVDEVTGGVRRVTYDLETLAERDRPVPPIRLAFFDPDAAAYRTVETRPVPLLVRPRPGATRRPPVPAPADGSSLGAIFGGLLLLAGILALVALVFVFRRRAHVRHRSRDRAIATRRALVEYRGRAADPEVDAADSFLHFLARLIDRPVTTVDSPDLGPRLRTAGFDPELASRAEVVLERLLAPRYGGPPSPEASAEARALAEELAREHGQGEDETGGS